MKRAAKISFFIILMANILLIILPTSQIDLYLTLFRPMIFAILTLFFMVFSPKKYEIASTNNLLTIICFFGAILLIAAYFLMGLIFGFGFNPMSSTAVLLLKNIWSFIILAILREYLRGKIMSTLGHKPATMIIVTLLFSFSFIDNIRSIVSYDIIPLLNALLHTLLPVLMLNFFWVYVSSTSSSTGNMLFMGIYQAGYFLSPVMPNVPKIVEAMIICLCVFVMYVIYDGMQLRNISLRKEYGRYPWKSLSLTASLGTVVILFVFGVFKYFPLVVISNSMKGVFSRGDVVIIRKIDQDSAKTTLQNGDIIEYKSEEGIAVIHRIIEVIGTKDNRRYITKGDNNVVADEKKVKPEQIVGTAKWFVPYIGYPTLLLTMR